MELFRRGVSGYRSVDNEDKASVLRHRSPVTPSPKSFELSVLPSPTHSIKKNLQEQQFIRIVGKPKPYSSTAHRTHRKKSIPSESTAAKPEDQKQKTTAHPEIQQTCKTTTATTIDSIDPIIDILDSGKDFIIARAKTDDPNDSSRSYYSYYAAHNINKVLFRTQPEEGLLHRMRAKNPLNNMTIIGDVHYYVVTKTNIPKNPLKINTSNLSSNAPKSPSISPQSTSSSARLASFEIFRKHKRPASADTSKSIKSKPAKQNNSGIVSTVENLLKLARIGGLQIKPDAQVQVTTKFKLNIIMKPDNVDSKGHSPNSIYSEGSPIHNIRLISYSNELKIHQISPSDWINAHAAAEISPQSETFLRKPAIEYYDAKYYASDDDFLMNSSVRAYFKENALDSVDAVLFTITAENLEVSSEEVEQHPALPGYVYSLQEERQERRHPFSVSRVIKVMVVCYIFMGIIMIKFLVPDNLVLLVVFVLIFFGCLMA
ncbi:hypothetical protein HK098_007170, partial [Nowakowskiella sp. JEL0407]